MVKIMAKSAQSNKAETGKAAPRAKRAGTKADNSNLIQLGDESQSPSLPNELNQKISKIDSDLDGLRKELSATNKGVKNSLAQLSNNDTDLTSRVSDAYKQLGELDGSYKSLTQKSSLISQEIKAVSKNITQLAKQSASDIGQLSEGYQELLARTDDLARKSKLATQNINKSIKQNAKAVSELETSLLAEIDSLANTTKERDDELGETSRQIVTSLSKTEESVKAQQARLIKLQAVDQALEKRSDQLESTTSELTKKSRELSSSTTVLSKRVDQLADSIKELQSQAQEHSGLIANLQDRTEQTAKVLFDLIMREKRHFRTLGVALVLVVLAITALFFHESANWSKESQTNLSLQSGIESTGAELAETNQQVNNLDNRLSGLDDRVTQIESSVQDELANVNHRLVNLDDQTDSLNGRINNLRPHRQFGEESTIHGPEWLASLDSSRYVIHVATVAEKQALYKLAERYNRYLTQELAYLPVQVNGKQKYVLVYGSFASRTEATSTLASLPRRLERHTPMVTSMVDVQHYLPK
jgi:chromosome segregation ATPase